jgi:predicted phage terminase large subunit-like protein
MTKQSHSAAEPAIKASPDDIRLLASSCMNGFFRYMLPSYHMGWVHRLICHSLDVFFREVQKQQSPRLLINMPPRHGKTTLVSHCFPAYCFGRDPNITIIATSYAATLAKKNNREVQKIMGSDRYRALFPATQLWGKNVVTVAHGTYLRNSETFEIVDHLGSYRSAGVGGGITGTGGHCLIVDDPIKNREDASSPTIREKLWDWYLSTLYTRQAPGAGIIIIQTRWHEDDLTGRLLELQKNGDGDEWKMLAFPAIAEYDEEFRRQGEALHPERYSVEKLEKIKRAVGGYDWAALYQQTPAPSEGQIFKRQWFQYWDELPEEFDKVILSWDMSFKDTASSDYVVGQAWGKKGPNFYLLDQLRAKMAFVDTCAAFKKMARDWPQAVEKLVEDKANGPAVIDALKREMYGIIAVEPEGSKISRAHSITGVFESGHVFLPRYSINNWRKDYENELLSFPSGMHDDQVDSTTQGIRRLIRRGGGNEITCGNPRVMSDLSIGW